MDGLFHTSKASDEGLSRNPEGRYDWGVHGTCFIPRKIADDSLNTAYYYSSGIETAGSAIKGICPVNLPNGAIISTAIVFGADSADTWTLKRIKYDTGTVQILSSGTFNTQDITISYSTIDNLNYGYFFETGTVDDNIVGARITYGR